MSTSKTSTDCCHNCRRLRIRCDGSLPQCHKCIGAARECLGYGRLLIWTNAIAYRGKLAGCTASTPAEASKDSKAQPFQQLSSVHECRHEQFIGSPRALVDPLFQDMDPSYQHYLQYFTQRVCHELLPQGSSGRNPYFQVIHLSKFHPLLQHTVVAVSAIHKSSPIKPPLYVAGNTASSTSLPGVEESSRYACQRRLAAKQKALKLMREAVQGMCNGHGLDMDAVSGEALLAAIAFLFYLELIESGKQGWKAHLRGVAKVLSLLPPAVPELEDLRNVLFSDSLICYVMGLTFTPLTVFDMEPIFTTSQLPPMLRRAAAYAYNSCPADILGILFEASWLASYANCANNQQDILETTLALMHRAQLFDVDAWANNGKNFRSLRPRPIQIRLDIGFAFKSAVCIYIIRVIPSINSERCYQLMAKDLTSNIISNLSNISDGYPDVIVLTWPTFFAGAEPSDASEREWAMQRMRLIASLWPWGYLFRAMDMLEKLWTQNLSDDGSECWVKTLKDTETDFVVF